LVNLVQAFDPDLIVLGGGLAADPGLFLPPVEQAMQLELDAGLPRSVPRLVMAELGERAAAIGAALLSRQLGAV
jgi:glucokinase